MRGLIVVLALMLGACGKQKGPEPVNEKTRGVGPYDIVLSAENESKPNAFSASINQDEGAVDFFLNGSDAVQYLHLASFTATVSGCNANAVEAIPVWYTAESNQNGEILRTGSTMITTPRSRAKLKMVFRGMQGCTQLNFSMVVQRLEVGNIVPAIDVQLGGTWEYGTAPGLTITMFAGTSRLGWLEGRGTNYTCDTAFYPSTAAASTGGWMVMGGATMLCKYQFADINKTQMDVNCYGHNGFGCTVPKNFRFNKR